MIKKILLIFTLIAFSSCSDNSLPDNCLRPVFVQINTDLNLPQFNNLVIGNAVELNGGAKGIIVFRKKTDEYAAFDRICPLNDCNTPMVYENRLLKCSCDGGTYSLDFGGAPQTDNFICPALEYRAIQRGSSLSITNF
ncbi:phosphoribosylaminoimidazole carboxylase [uncultured Polaribacter sp.]|uniref:phosphoribosylaminoimidazole carboxylase n=1 Tax=uncultured Polaribacter sp. TaxID=174711 RepID=UPI002618FB0E|nr:phosphoribosylaminoimidazole carboxylase [uncultured Polaribacter sp.]